MSEKLQLIKIKNPFNRAERDITTVDYIEGQSLLDIRNAHFPQDVPVVTSLNGRVVNIVDLASIKPTHGDCIVFTPEIQGGDDGKGVLAMIAMIIIAIFANVAGAAILGYSGPGSVAAAWAGNFVAMALITSAIMITGGLLVNSLMPKPKLPGSDFDTAQVFSWNPQTTQQQGTCIPKYYGTNKLYGNIIAAHLENQGKRGEKQYINALIALGIGPYKRLHSFKINDQPVENLKGVEIHTRLGEINQTTIPNFNDTKTEYPMSVKITKTSPYTYTTIGNNFHALEVDITFPRGIFRLNDEGKLRTHKVTLKIEIRKQGDSTWIPITQLVTSVATTSYSGKWSAGYWEYDESGNAYWKEIAVGNTDPYSHYEGEPYSYDYNNAYWRWITVPSEQTVSHDEDIMIISGNKTTAITRSLRVNNLPLGRYEIKVSKISNDKTSSQYGDDMYLTAVREVLYDDFEYPRHVLCGIRALATDQLSGSLRFSCIAECSKVRIWNGTSWTVDYSDNPAWIAYDILTQPVIDNNSNVVRYDGYHPSRLDLAKFKEWADFCDTLVPNGKGGTEKRITFNGGFDYETTVWEAFLTVCQVGRAFPILNGRGISLWIDKPTQPTMTFTAGNITKDSFKEAFLPIEERATEIEIDFINAENDYKREKFSVLNPNITTKINKVSLQLHGCTKPSEAWRYASYKLANNQYIFRSATFTTSVEAIACLIGDVVNVAHEVPQWGYSGRLVSATASSVTLDRKVTIESGKSYALLIVYSTPSMVTRNGVNYICKSAHTADTSNAPGTGSNWSNFWDIGGDGSSGAWTSGRQYVNGDYVIERSVTSGVGEHETLSVNLSGIDLPRRYDMYSFGEISKVIKPFRVLDIQPTQDLEHTLHLIEYNESIYNTDLGQPVLPTPNYSAIEPLGSVIGLKLEPEFIKNSDGTVSINLNIYYTKPTSPFWSHAEIWRLNEGVWVYIGSTPTEKYTINNIDDNTTHTIAVLTVDTIGRKETFQQAAKETIFVSSRTIIPPDVAEFWGEASIGGLDLRWSSVEDSILSHYKIRYTPNTSGTWDEAINIATITGTSITLHAAKSGMYLIKAVNVFGNESQNAKALITDIPKIIAWNVKETLTESPTFPGTKTNMYVSEGALCLGTADLVGYYETSAINLGSVQTSRCSSNVVYYGVNTTLMWDHNTELVDSDEMIDGDVTGIEVITQIALSQDGSTFSGWQNFFVGDFTARAYKFRLKASTVESNQYPKITTLQFIVDMPDRVEVGQDVSIPATGSNITFSKPFMIKPKIGITIQSAQTGDFYVLSNVSTTGFTIQIRNSSGGVSRTIDWEARGY